MIENSLESQESADRRAIEAILGRPLDGRWPVEAMKPGTRVRIINDESWEGPWRDVFTGTIDATMPRFRPSPFDID
jgi:hypothetical protein